MLLQMVKIHPSFYGWVYAHTHTHTHTHTHIYHIIFIHSSVDGHDTQVASMAVFQKIKNRTTVWSSNLTNITLRYLARENENTDRKRSALLINFGWCPSTSICVESKALTCFVDCSVLSVQNRTSFLPVYWISEQMNEVSELSANYLKLPIR